MARYTITCACGWEMSYGSYVTAQLRGESHLLFCSFYRAAQSAGKEECMAHFGGKTGDVSAPILGAKFWKKKTQITGKVVRSFNTDNGICYTLKLIKAIPVDRSMT